MVLLTILSRHSYMYIHHSIYSDGANNYIIIEACGHNKYVSYNYRKDQCSVLRGVFNVSYGKMLNIYMFMGV